MEQKFLPENFDFSNSVLKGTFDRYKFVSKVSEGSQGIVLQYEGVETRQKIVYKIARTSSENMSSQIKDEKNNSLQFMLNEKDYLTHLSLIARIGAFVQKSCNTGRLKIDNGIHILDDKKLSLDDFLSMSSAYNNINHIRSCDNTISPIIVDYASILHDKNGQDYLPIFNPEGSPIAKHLLFVLTMGPDTTLPIYSFEEGETLDKVLKENLSIEEREEIALNLIKAVMILHGFGILHRDLKPENIIVTPKDEIKILDFGITQHFAPSDRIADFANLIHKGIDLNKLHHKNFMGKDWYGSRFFSSPETTLKKRSNQDDIYSIGVLCALILTGKHPYCDEYTIDNTTDLKRSYANEMKVLATGKKELVKKYTIKYNNFLEENNQLELLQKISPMFHFKNENRPIRMIQICKELGLEYPLFPQILDDGEYSSINSDVFGKIINRRMNNKGNYVSLVSFSRFIFNFLPDNRDFNRFL